MRYQEACKILGVEMGSLPEEVKTAHRRRARETHPDRHPDDPQAVVRFREVQEAYEVAINAAASRHANAPARQAAWPGSRQPRAVEPGRGKDVVGDLTLTLSEAFSGTVTDVTFMDRFGCERCGATGGEPDASLISCPACLTGQAGCGWCHGSGQLLDPYCAACLGAGVVEDDRTVRVIVPRSPQGGQELTLPGKGKWGMQGHGDLRLRLVVDEPQGMRRIGDDIEVDVTIGVLQAVLGGFAYVPTLEQMRHKIAVSAGSSSGKRFRLKGHGMYRSSQGDDRGDLYAVIHIRVPEQLTDRERHLYQLLLEEEIKRAQTEDGEPAV